MAQFATSAGFWGSVAEGHSGGGRWPLGERECLWVSFFPLGGGLRHHLAAGLRCWMEALALEEHLRARGNLPVVNRLEGSRRGRLKAFTAK